MEEDEDMREQKQVVYQSLKGFSTTKGAILETTGFEIGPEYSEDEDVLKTGYEDAKQAASQLNILHDRLKDLRRKTFEPITRLLGRSTTERWTPATQTAAKQVFLKYFCKC